MKPIAVWYHARLSGGTPPVDEKCARKIHSEQVQALIACGLPWIEEDSHCCLYEAGSSQQTEIPTLHKLQQWLPGHEDWYVLYFHAKGAKNREPHIAPVWRLCMEKVVLWRWRECVAALDEGYDTAGAHWLTKEEHAHRFPNGNWRAPSKYSPGTPIWGGNFWWSKASYLKTLAPLPENWRSERDDFLAEDWIGSGPNYPKAKDFAHHWPSVEMCSKAIQ